MELKLNEHELNYITSVIEQNLEQLNGIIRLDWDSVFAADLIRV